MHAWHLWLSCPVYDKGYNSLGIVGNLHRLRRLLYPWYDYLTHSLLLLLIDTLSSIFSLYGIWNPLDHWYLWYNYHSSLYLISLGDYLILEDITNKFIHPCILDLKIGRRVWEDNAHPDKIKKELKKYPPQQNLGFRITAMRVSISCNSCSIPQKHKNKPFTASLYIVHMQYSVAIDCRGCHPLNSVFFCRYTSLILMTILIMIDTMDAV